MNNAKMWLVVKPTVGVPLFLSAVAIGSFAVHVAVLTNTGWVGDFLSGRALGTTATARLATQDMLKSEAAYVAPADGQRVLVIMPDGTTATGVLEGSAVKTSAAPGEKLIVN
jgi:light-harvesting protein B-800-850 alpha chain